MNANPGTPAGPNIEYIQCDLSDAQAVGELFKAHAFNAVVNTAALSQPAVCESDPAAARCGRSLQPVLDACLKGAVASRGEGRRVV